jgi:hypothetical protein
MASSSSYELLRVASSAVRKKEIKSNKGIRRSEQDEEQLVSQ